MMNTHEAGTENSENFLQEKKCVKTELEGSQKLQPCKVGGVPGLGQAEQYCTLSKPVH